RREAPRRPARAFARRDPALSRGRQGAGPSRARDLRRAGGRFRPVRGLRRRRDRESAAIAVGLKASTSPPRSPRRERAPSEYRAFLAGHAPGGYGFRACRWPTLPLVLPRRARRAFPLPRSLRVGSLTSTIGWGPRRRE